MAPKRKPSSPISIGNCQITVEASPFTCNSGSNDLLVSLPRRGKIKVSAVQDAPANHRNASENIRSEDREHEVSPKDVDDNGKSYLQFSGRKEKTASQEAVAPKKLRIERTCRKISKYQSVDREVNIDGPRYPNPKHSSLDDITEPKEDTLEQEKVQENIESLPLEGLVKKGRKDKSSLIHSQSIPDFSVDKQMIEEDPKAIMDKLLYDDLSQSSKTPTTQTDSTQPGKIPTEQMLNDLRDLVFSKHKHLMEHLPNDSKLRESIKLLNGKLANRIEDMTVQQQAGFSSFIQFFENTLLNIDASRENKHSLEVSTFQFWDSSSKFKASVDEHSKLDEYIRARREMCSDINIQIGGLQAQIKQLENQAQIKQLENQVKSLQHKESLLEETWLECLKEKNKLHTEINNSSIGHSQLTKKICQFRQKEKELHTNYDKFREIYAKMKSNPPF